MRRKRKQQQQRRLLLLVVILGLVVYGIVTLVDQQRLFARHENDIQQKEETIANLEREIDALEEEQKYDGSLYFVEEYARKNGMQPTELTPVLIPGILDYESTHESTSEETESP